MLHQKSTFLAIAAISLLSMPLAHAHRIDSTKAMTETAKRLLASLTSEQSGKATFKFEDDERMNWHFIPKERKGLPLKDMTPPQKHLATALAKHRPQPDRLHQGHDHHEPGRYPAHHGEGQRRTPRPRGYFFTIFGKPGDNRSTWGCRVEGHHLALNFTSERRQGDRRPELHGRQSRPKCAKGLAKVSASWHAEEDLGRALVKSLTPEQKKVAVVSKEAPKDILTMADRKASTSRPSRMACKPRS